MEKIFELNGKEYTVKPCTAISMADYHLESDRQDALLVSNTADSGEVVRFVVFGWYMPETLDDFTAMCDDESAWEGDWGTLVTVRGTEPLVHPEAAKPCPFCGGTEIRSGSLRVICDTCKASMSAPLGVYVAGTSKRAMRENNIRAWNQRHSHKKRGCPFCGSDNVDLSHSGADRGLFWVYCKDCFAGGPDSTTEDGAVEVWDNAE